MASRFSTGRGRSPGPDWDQLFSSYEDPARRRRLIDQARSLVALGDDDASRVVAVVEAEQRRRALASQGIRQAWGIPCPCYLVDSRGRLHRRRHPPVGAGYCYPGGGYRDHVSAWRRGDQLVAVTYEPYFKVSGDAIAAVGEALAVDDLTVSVCTCCTLHYPGRTVAAVISRASDPAPHITP